MATRKAQFEVNLRELMRQRGIQRGELLTQVALAEETGLSYPTIRRWNSGRVARMEAETAAVLTDYFGCALSDLVKVVR